MADDTKQPYVDPAHRVPDDKWAEIVRKAKQFREESEEKETE